MAGTHLETLKLYRVSDDALRALAGIARIDFMGRPHPTDAAGGLRALVSLTHLDLSSCIEVSTKGLVALAAGGLTNLTHLNLSGCYNYNGHLSENGVIALAGGLPSLMYLDIEGCKGVQGRVRRCVHCVGGAHRTHPLGHDGSRVHG
jgi:hypothetical protein